MNFVEPVNDEARVMGAKRSQQGQLSQSDACLIPLLDQWTPTTPVRKGVVQHVGDWSLQRNCPEAFYNIDHA